MKRMRLIKARKANNPVAGGSNRMPGARRHYPAEYDVLAARPGPARCGPEPRCKGRRPVPA